MKTSKFIIYADCIPVKGSKRSIICDTQNNTYHFIPNGLYDILMAYNGQTVEKIKMDYKFQYNDIIDEYFDFLIANKLIFFTQYPDLFPKISTDWDSPSLITNIIIDYDEMIHDFCSLLPQFEFLKCSYLQLRFFKKTSIEYIFSIAEMLKKINSRVVSIDFILPYYKDLDVDMLNIFLLENSRIHSLILYDSPIDVSYNPVGHKMGYLMQIKKNIINEKNCGMINKEYFYSNIKLFSESQHFNTCLNRKLSIDKHGNIKNCPSMLDNYGNIKNTSLLEAVSHPTFKKYWNITKDQIEVCKDCEFRHVCTDCRAYIEDPENIYSKPLKCGYNPYTNQWEEWSTNPLKQKAIKHYSLQEIIQKNV